MKPISDLAELLRSMEPELRRGAWAFVTLGSAPSSRLETIVATVREPEGWSAIVEEQEARRRGLTISFLAEWITLKVHSDLQAVGLTAAVATALAAAGISCNVVAGVHHDHLFVPAGRGEEAVAVLAGLAGENRSGGNP